MVLVDTSVFINYFKGNDSPGVRHLDGLADGGFCVTPIILQELLHDDRDFDAIASISSLRIF